jgi:hypothetical protein
MLRLNSKVQVSSARFQSAMVKASAVLSATYQLFVSVDDKGKPFNPVSFRLPDANGGIDSAIAALMGMDYDDSTEKTKRATGVKLSYPANIRPRVKAKLGTWIEPARLAAIVNFLAENDTPPVGMSEEDYRAHLDSAGMSDLIEVEENANTDETQAPANRANAKTPVA